MINNRQKGLQGEIKASEYIKGIGYDVLDRNYRTRHGEIDIIGFYNGMIIFIEVKLRSSLRYGYPVESISIKKASTIRIVAQEYISQKRLCNYPIRFDVIEIFKGENFRINHIENAF